MIKIEIEIDAEKARKECQYTPESMMKCLDTNFANKGFPILEADEFRRVYRDSSNTSVDLGRMGVLVAKFARCEWFAKSVKKIIWYDNEESDDSDDWNVEDFMEALKTEKVGYFSDKKIENFDSFPTGE